MVCCITPALGLEGSPEVSSGRVSLSKDFIPLASDATSAKCAYHGGEEATAARWDAAVDNSMRFCSGWS